MVLSPQSYRAIIESVRDGIYLVDTQRRILFWNRGAEQISGFRMKEVCGRSCADQVLTHTDRKGLNLCKDGCPLAQTIIDGQPREADVFLHHKRGHRIPVRVKVAAVRDATGRILGAVETFHDNGSLHRAKQTIDALRKVALLDTATGLTNRQGIEAKLKAMIHETRSTGRKLGILLANIDALAEISQRHGRTVGEKVLRMVGQTLANAMRPSDVIGRWADTTFAAILPDLDQADLVNSAENALLLVQNSYLGVDTGIMRATTSIGAALLARSDTPADLLEKASKALTLSESSGQSRVTFYRHEP